MALDGRYILPPAKEACLWPLCLAPLHHKSVLVPFAEELAETSSDDDAVRRLESLHVVQHVASAGTNEGH